jgi:hypothetical protein
VSVFLKLQDYQTKQCDVLQTDSMTLKEFEKVNNVLNTTIKIVTKTVKLLHQKAQGLQKKQLSCTKAVISLNQKERSNCGKLKVVSTCKAEVVTVGSYFRYSGTSNSGHRATFRNSVTWPSSGIHLEDSLISLPIYAKF